MEELTRFVAEDVRYRDVALNLVLDGRLQVQALMLSLFEKYPDVDIADRDRGGRGWAASRLPEALLKEGSLTAAEPDGHNGRTSQRGFRLLNVAFRSLPEDCGTISTEAKSQGG